MAAEQPAMRGRGRPRKIKRGRHPTPKPNPWDAEKARLEQQIRDANALRQAETTRANNEATRANNERQQADREHDRAEAALTELAEFKRRVDGLSLQIHGLCTAPEATTTQN